MVRITADFRKTVAIIAEEKEATKKVLTSEEIEDLICTLLSKLF